MDRPGRRVTGTFPRPVSVPPRHRLLPARLTVLAGLALPLLLATKPALGQEPEELAETEPVRFYDLEDPASGTAGVRIPAGRAQLWTSALGPPVFNERAEPGTRERYGDTKIQAVGALLRLESQLESRGLGMSDVAFLRAHLAVDPQTGSVDRDGWNEAYAEFFGTDLHPNRPAGSVVAVTGLSDPDWLVEIEAVAVFPDPQ